ncbi:TetR/AcrR family transcriptional regulator [Metabacillus arenae]|uniref:TetR/AcrR family transcriptional regulator n=1 Tax=Metabacillus arenae TaxID=2771434 RepID=A0A926NCX4_9BACI|nr:TetR/AcrR family transcriptional regulator [Metabacillus arenae]MBD1378911.1 TetR/AcrR family transcriptional regulator [Metabacillus arenae]
MKNNHSKSEAILSSAAQIIRKEGVARLTLEAVAKHAGVSKGGLLYHFSSKDDLIKAMVTKLMVSFDTGVQARIEADNIETGRSSRAYVEDTFDYLNSDQDVSPGLLAAIATNPELLTIIQQSFAKWQNQIENDGIDPVKATIIRLASDGLWLSDLFGLAPIDENLQKKVKEELISMTRGI